MATTRLCDRCGTHISGAVAYGWVGFGEAHDGETDPKAHDLCLGCLAALRCWMTKEPK
jgi:hypothetical protein